MAATETIELVEVPLVAAADTTPERPQTSPHLDDHSEIPLLGEERPPVAPEPSFQSMLSRTYMAWIRTGLSHLVFALLLFRMLVQGEVTVMKALVVGVVLILLALTFASVAAMRYAHMTREYKVEGTYSTANWLVIMSSFTTVTIVLMLLAIEAAY